MFYEEKAWSFRTITDVKSGHGLKRLTLIGLMIWGHLKDRAHKHSTTIKAGTFYVSMFLFKRAPSTEFEHLGGWVNLHVVEDIRT